MSMSRISGLAKLAEMASQTGRKNKATARADDDNAPDQDEVEERDEDDQDEDEDDNKSKKKKSKKRAKDEREDDECEDDDEGDEEKLTVAQRIIRAGEKRRGERPSTFKPPKQGGATKVTSADILAAAKKRRGEK